MQIAESIKEFNSERQRLNDIVMQHANLPIKRFFSLDTQTYREEDGGGLSAKHKELQGLVASLVLRCDDCIRYHVLQAYRTGASAAEFCESANVALVVGGSIVIPHLRRAFETWDLLQREGMDEAAAQPAD